MATSAAATAASEAAASVPRTRTGDDRKPGCSRCNKAGIECVRGYNIRFKHGSNPSVANLKGSGLAKTEYDFSDSQPWVRTDRNLTFLDETPELNSLYDRDFIDVIAYGPEKAPKQAEPQAKPQAHAQPVPVPEQRSKETSQHPSPSDQLPAVVTTPAGSAPDRSPLNVFGVDESRFHENAAPEKRRRLTTSGYVSYGESFPGSVSSGSPNNIAHSPANFWDSSSHSGWTPAGIESNLDIGPQNAASDPSFAGLQSSLVQNTGGPNFASVSDTFSRIYLETPIWPLKDREEARLLRYFVEHLARSFDLTDPLQHFRRVVPQRASICPPLLNAIFALSARHLSRTGEYDHLISNKYIQACLQHLIPMLDDSSALQDENLLASTIILRHVEEIEVPLSGQQPAEQESHLFGAHAFITAQERATITGGLRQAAFWVGLRQEIYVAFVNQRSIIPALEHCNIDRSFEAAPDDIWACRMVVLAADIIRYCFGEHDHPHSSTYTFLADCATQWFSSKPASFLPVFEKKASESENVFPELHYVADDVVTGMQHYYLARILLVAHNPKIPRLGPLRTAALRAADAEVMEYIRILCGICASNPDSPPNFNYAAMAIVVAGDKFTLRREQKAVLEILETCDRKHAWMTGTVQANLKSSWGWVEEEEG
ncbi:hypothetical protein Q7P37_003586 [Cladosporium fusiforme]